MNALRTQLARIIVAGNAAKTLPIPGNLRDLLARQIEFDAVLVDTLGRLVDDQDATLTAALTEGKK